MKKNLRTYLGVVVALAVFSITFLAHKAPASDKTISSTKADISQSGIFAPVPDTSNAPAPPDVTASPVAVGQPSQPMASDNRRAQPDWSFTPGRLCTPNDSDFKEYRYPEHIAYCNRNVTLEMKQQVATHYGIPQSEWHNYEFDHLVPLCIGGNSQVDNLWPQPRGPTESDGKDVLENQLYQGMKAGAITQAEAVKQNYAWFGPGAPDRVIPKATVQPTAQPTSQPAAQPTAP